MLGFFESILYGFVSGCAEILPVSSRAHQSLMQKIFGVEGEIPLCNLLIHLALIFAVYYSCRSTISRLQRDSRLSGRTRGRTYKTATYFDRRLLKGAAIPMIVGLFLHLATAKMTGNFLWIALFMAINGVLLLVQDHLPHGNRNASKMTALDATFMGLLSILSVFPGISRNTMILSYGIARGADRTSVTNWMLLLTIPALVVLCVLDVISIFSVGFGISSFLAFVFCIVAAVAAFAGGYLAVMLVRVLTGSGYSSLAYYSFGTALFTVVLYLIA